MFLAMNHHGPAGGMSAVGWLIVGGIGLVVLLIAVFAYFRVRQSDGLSRSERRQLDPMAAEILAMLRQTGRPLAQSEVSDLASAEVEDVARAAESLEAQGFVQRAWSSEQQTYLLSPT